MQTITYILKDIQPFKLKDDIVHMMKTFDQHPFSHLPVVDAKLFYGAISREEVELIITEKIKLNDFKHLIEPFYATENMNWFEVLQNFATHNTNLMPVLNAKKNISGIMNLMIF